MQLDPSPLTGQENQPVKGDDFALVIDSRRRWTNLGLRELWHYRELLFFLVWRDLKVRYRQTFLGASWAVAQPLLTMVIFSLVFGRLAKVPTDGIPYPLLAFLGLLPWQLFANSLSQSSSSLVSNRAIILKVYFPRLIIPISAVMSGLVDFAVAFAILLVMMMYYKVTLTITFLLVPVFVIMAMLSALAVGLWMAALNVKYRDVKFMVPFITQIWMFASPVAYLGRSVPQKWQLLYNLNPMVGVIDGFRWAVLGTGQGISVISLVSVGVFILFLLGGMWHFRRTEKVFADVL